MLVYALLACQSASVAVVTPEDPAPRDTETLPEHDPVDTDREDVGENPPPVAPVVVFDPPAGTFVGSVTVDLVLEPGETALYTLDGSAPDRGDAWSGPLTLDASAELRVWVDNGALQTWATATYVELEPDVADFTSNLPLVVLWSEERAPEGDEDYVPFTVQIHDRTDGTATLLGAAAQSARAGLRIRGSSTSSDDKHSWALETRGDADDDDADVGLLDMPAESDWVLYAPYTFDRAFIRNALMYRLSNEIGRYAPRTRFVEVFEASRGDAVDRDGYVGIYVLMERIKRAEDRVNVEKLAPEDVLPPEVTGGYVFKRDRTGDGESGFWAGEADGAYRFDDPLVLVTPQESEIERAQEDYLFDTIDAFADSVVEPDGIGPDGLHYRDQIDVDSFIDHHVLNLYAKNPDALRLSAYMYKDREGPIVAGPVWDFDRAIGCDDDGRSSDPTWWDARNYTVDCTAMWTYGWYGGLYQHQEYRDAYWTRARELLDDTLAVAHVHAVIDEMAAEIGPDAAERNFRAWPASAPHRGSFQGEIDHLKSWFEARHAWIVACMDAYPDAPELCPGG